MNQLDDTGPRITVFAGTVGAGKSTQMRLLAAKLKARGTKVRTTYLKTGHLPAYLLEVVIARIACRGSRYGRPIRALVEEKPRLFRRLFKLWLALDIIGVSIKFLLNIHIPTKAGFLVLVEDYVPATIVDYMCLTKAIGLPLGASSSTSKFMLRLQHLGGPFQVIFLDAQTDALKFRWSHRKQLEERPDYIRMQRSTLLSLSNRSSSGRLLYVNTTNQTIERVHKLITNHLTAVEGTGDVGRHLLVKLPLPTRR